MCKSCVTRTSGYIYIMYYKVIIYIYRAKCAHNGPVRGTNLRYERILDLITGGVIELMYVFDIKDVITINPEVQQGVRRPVPWHFKRKRCFVILR